MAVWLRRRRGVRPGPLPIRGPSAAELGGRYDEARRWAADWERAARGPLHVEYKTVGRS